MAILALWVMGCAGKPGQIKSAPQSPTEKTTQVDRAALAERDFYANIMPPKTRKTWRTAVTGKATAVVFVGDAGQISDELLDQIDSLDLKTTFFVTGTSAAQSPVSLKNVAKRGHEIGSLGFTNELPPASEMEESLRATNRAIFEAVGRRPALFMPPLSSRSFNQELVDQAAMAGMITVAPSTGQITDGSIVAIKLDDPRRSDLLLSFVAGQRAQNRPIIQVKLENLN